MSQFLIGTVSILLVFGLAVFVHEFGHMMFALLRGVGVESFAIGMGPRIVSWQWRGIDWSLRWFPVGGFVKLKGMIKEEAEAAGAPAIPSPTEEPGGVLTVHDVKVDDGSPNQDEKSLSESSYDDLLALANKGFVTKLLVFGGGVFMNFLTAIAAMALLLFIGHPEPRFRFVVDKVTPNTPVATAGLQPNDRIVALNGDPVQYRDEFEDALVRQARDRKLDLATDLIPLKLTVERAGGTRADLDIPPMRFTDFSESFEIKLPPIVGAVLPHLPADKAGIKPGDRILAVNGTPIDSFSAMAELVRPQLGKEVAIKIQRGSETHAFTMTPTASIDNENEGAVGITNGSEEVHKVREPNPLRAIARAPKETALQGYGLVMMQVEFFKRASFKQIRDNLGGPIAIADLTQRKAREGFPELLMWFINLNLLLATFNLLPLPVLDGGFILLSVIEGIMRRPVSPRILQPIYTVFVIFFILLMLTISLLDIKRFLS